MKANKLAEIRRAEIFATGWCEEHGYHFDHFGLHGMKVIPEMMVAFAALAESAPGEAEIRRAAAGRIDRDALAAGLAKAADDVLCAFTPDHLNAVSGSDIGTNLQRALRAFLDSCLPTEAEAALVESQGTLPLNQRGWDLLRYCRHDLHNDGLISDVEYTQLLLIEGAVDRLEDYDAAKARLATSARSTEGDVASRIANALGAAEMLNGTVADAENVIAKIFSESTALPDSVGILDLMPPLKEPKP
jgi:hypothetical protein